MTKTISAMLLPEFDQEMKTSRRLIERVPADKGPWKPHEKSFPLGHLTQLVATMPGWITRTLKEPVINLAEGAGYSFQSTESLLQQFDQHVREAHDAIAESSDDHFASEWALMLGEQVIMKLLR